MEENIPVQNIEPRSPDTGGADSSLGTSNTPQCAERQKVIKPADVIPAITEAQCENLQDNHGIYGDKNGNCDDLTGELLCDMRQDLEYVINMGVGNIFANDDSKCSDDDPSPTLASMWSRIYRFAQAVTCILCAYDPFISTLLKAGRFPQVLMGAQTETDGTMDGCCKKVGYPTWVDPDDYPREGSNRPVTSDGITRAVQDAILSVWHLWEEKPEFTYFAQTIDSSSDPFSLTVQMEKWPAVEGDTALIASDPTNCSGGTAEWEYRHDNDPSGDLEVKWRFNKCLNKADDNLTNFATTHVNKGYYEDKGVYYFDGTWQVMDASFGELEKRVDELEAKVSGAVTSPDGEKYILTTAATVTDANNVPCSDDKTTIILVTG